MSPMNLERISLDGILLKVTGLIEKYFPKQEENNNYNKMEWRNGLKAHKRYQNRVERMQSQNSYSQTSEIGSEDIF